MEEKKRTWLAILISCIILLAVGYSFGLNFFRSTADIVVADPGAAPSQSLNPGGAGNAAGIPVDVTPQTVQSIIADMSRYKSYRRNVEIRYFWGEGEPSVITARVVENGGWIRCETQLPGGLTEHSILGGGSVWCWYDDGPEYLQLPAEAQAEDLVQHIPTYEDVLGLEKESITRTAYEAKNGVPCIFVEVKREELGYVEQYWVSTASGLLYAARTEKDGAEVYSMTSGDVLSPITPDKADFTLPDGTVLLPDGD